jgi:hypothetical protein
MSRSAILAVTLALGACFAAQAAEAPAGGADTPQPTTVRFKTLELKAPWAVVTPRHEREYLSLYEGLVKPHDSVSVTRKGPVRFTAAGEDFELLFKQKQVGLRFGGKAAALPRNGPGLKTTMVPVSDQKRVPIAFPMAFISSKGAKVYYRSGAIRVGKLGKAPLVLYDDDFSGTYSPSVDAIRVGNGLTFAPLTRHISLGDRVATIEAVEPDGSSLTAVPYSGPLGKIEIELKRSKGGVLDCAFFSEDAATSFVCSSRRGTFAVPPGTYKLCVGAMRDSHRGTPIVRLGAVGKEMPGVAVKEGQTAKLVIGDRLQMSFDAQIKGKNLYISSHRLGVKGAAGETYVGADWVGSPDVFAIAPSGQTERIGDFSFG